MSEENSFPKILDKNNNIINIGDIVRYYAKDNSTSEEDVQEGLAKIGEFNFKEEAVDVYFWIEQYSVYSKNEHSWPVKWSEKEQSYFTYIDLNNSLSWLEREADAYSFNQPIEIWPNALSTITMNFIQEENIRFCLRNNELSEVQVADPNGLLGAIINHGNHNYKKIYGDDSSIPIVYFAHPESMAGMSFDFDKANNEPRNSLYFHSHFLLSTLQDIVDNSRMQPESMIDGMIQLDEIVQEWFVAVKELKVNVLAYRPKPVDKKSIETRQTRQSAK